VDRDATGAVLVNIAYVAPASDGFVTAWAAGSPRPPTANVNASAGEVVSNLAIVPVGANGAITLFAYAAGHVVVDLLGRFDAAPGAVAAGRFVALDPARLADTREVSGTVGNTYSREPAAPYPRVSVPVLGRRGVPAVGVSSVVLVVTALSGPARSGGFLTASPGSAAWPGTANVNTNGVNDIRPNTVVVPVGDNGAVDLHLHVVEDVVVDVAGYFTDATVAPSTAGRFVSITPTREADSRVSFGFGRLEPRGTRTLDPATVPDGAVALVHNIALVGNDGPGFVTPFPAPPLPLVAAGNATAPGQVRSIHTVTKLGDDGVINYFALMSTDLVVDVTGYFVGAQRR
jgi:hypothetical protein